MKRIVLLYNDRDRPFVKEVYARLGQALQDFDVMPWMASEDMTMFGDIFDNVENAIRDAVGAVIFLGVHGLGRFQENIERGAVNTEIWQRGSTYGRLLVHLAPALEVPRPLLSWPTVNHDGTLVGSAALAQGIVQRFGFRLPSQRIEP